MSDKWECNKCGRKNPSSRYVCFKRGCKGMSQKGLQKFVAMIGLMQ